MVERKATGPAADPIQAIIDAPMTPSPAAETIIAEEVEAERVESRQAAERSVPGANPPSGFDPRIHVERDGKPVLNSDGTYRRKPGRAKRASVDTTQAATEAGEGPPENNDAVQAELRRRCALMASGVTFTLCQAIGGPEFLPMVDVDKGIDEPRLVAGGWEEYFKSRGNIDLPPWAALAVALSAYIAPRLAMPQTQSRLATIWLWMRGKVQSWKARRQARTGSPFTQAAATADPGKGADSGA